MTEKKNEVQDENANEHKPEETDAEVKEETADTAETQESDSGKETKSKTEPDKEPDTEAFTPTNEGGIRWLAALAYLPLICLIPLFLNRDDEFIQKHAKQGFILFLIEISAMLMKIDAIWNLIIFICLAAAIVGALGIIVRGEVRIPILSDLADRLNI